MALAELSGAVDAVLSDLMLIGFTLSVAFAILSVVVSVVAYRRLRRAAPLRRGLLAVRSRALPPGSGRSLAQLRRALDSSVRSTRACVEQAQARGQRVNDLPRSIKRLAKAARLLDANLRDLEREVDPIRQTAQIPAARERVRQLTDAAAVVRDAVCATSGALGDIELRTLAGEVDEQALRLTTWNAAYRELQAAGVETGSPAAVPIGRG